MVQKPPIKMVMTGGRFKSHGSAVWLMDYQGTIGHQGAAWSGSKPGLGGPPGAGEVTNST